MVSEKLAYVQLSALLTSNYSIKGCRVVDPMVERRFFIGTEIGGSILVCVNMSYP